ncbi:copper resistance CopC/CopD family protein [Robertmurraya kyonggiensis]|uniref:Copper transport protein n=1 Tax=Robertmurraya kyonggiensis TaxID=1037680 RepID=A0A4U1D8F7_9BACI|nr:copper resistance protein CopC [Robertmurraya kyonggiensis]TKC18845.1 hypothetical protein FA727_04620 [Robertmurraya kyonggiensis]
MSKKILKNILFVFVLFVMIPQGVFAHATLEKANPAPDSQLDAAPKEIVLQFNERLEKELYSIKVFDENGDSISKKETKISKDQKSISQSLSELPDGLYTISYKVISADGHPVDGSYVVSIGEGNILDTSALDLHTEENNSGFFNTMNSIIRILYYTALLLTTGWLLWGTFHSLGSRETYRKWFVSLQISLIISTILMGAMQFTELLDSWSIKGILSILTGTSLGISLTVSVLLTILGFVLLFRFNWLDRFWVLLLLVAKSISGHAMAFEPPIVTILLDIVHLLAAAIWAGGLFYILVFWRKKREEIRAFLPTFSNFALASLLILIITGTASTLIFLPKMTYLLYTTWGKMLLVKMAFVLLVVVIGGVLRYRLKKKQEHLGTWLKVDFSMMVLILVIVGIMTHLNPLPQNKPLEWHDQKDNIEFTFSITPNAPGTNHFMIFAKSYEEGVKIKRVNLYLSSIDNPELAPIEVPFTDGSMLDGNYLPFPGKWSAELRILDSEDNEVVFYKDFMIY